VKKSVMVGSQASQGTGPMGLNPMEVVSSPALALEAAAGASWRGEQEIVAGL
jgi:hypothetical protein